MLAAHREALTEEQEMTTISLKDTTEVVAYIASAVAKSIAEEGFAGHDLETVGRRMTTDAILSTIRSAYVFRCERGYNRPESIAKIGSRLIAEYYRQFDLG
jgi:hypothetical protein